VIARLLSAFVSAAAPSVRDTFLANAASIEQSYDELDVQDQMQTTWNLVFFTLRFGESVAFAKI
jgi:hypothetical protein